MRALVEHVVPGRWSGTRQPSSEELVVTLIVELPLGEASAKLRSGDPSDAVDDYFLPYWAGVIPQAGALVADSKLDSTISMPSHGREYRLPDRRSEADVQRGLAPPDTDHPAPRAAPYLLTISIIRSALSIANLLPKEASQQDANPPAVLSRSHFIMIKWVHYVKTRRPRIAISAGVPGIARRNPCRQARARREGTFNPRACLLPEHLTQHRGNGF